MIRAYLAKREARITRKVERERATQAHVRARLETIQRAGAMFPELYADARQKRGLA